MGLLEKAEFGAHTFFASSHSNDQCGANGLPLTPNSIKILGRFQKLKTISHPRLCKYLDLQRGKHERLIVVQEHYRDSLDIRLKKNYACQPEFLIRVAYEVLVGLAHLNENGIVHRNLSVSNVLFSQQGAVKLSGFGMYHMTGGGADVSFPIGYSRYMAPEVLLQGPAQVKDHQIAVDQPLSSPKVDVWSLGILLLEILMERKLWINLSLHQAFHKIISFIGTDKNPAELILKENNCEEKLKTLPPDLQVLIRSCLTVSPHQRPYPAELLNGLSVFKTLRSQEKPLVNGFRMCSTELRCRDLYVPDYSEDPMADDEDHLGEREIDEVYYFWKLAGGDLESILKKEGLIKSHPPITATANFITDDGEVFGLQRDYGELFDDQMVILSQDTLRQRLQNIDEASYYPLLEDESAHINSLPTSPSSGDLSQTATLPLIIREKDIEYQFHRTILYQRLISAYPYKRQHIWKEARVDIPPLVRGHVWAALLEVEGDVQGNFDAIDKETPTPTDRQIEVDIPRCHQYSDLLSSPEGHAKFKRVLKAWVVSHPQYVYWQGLDSLCAPFLYLNFNDEALTYACLSAFIPKYLHKFFLKDNSQVIQEYLAVFTHLIAFHDPELSSHLDGIGFIPDLYAIPWFLTMYAHVFPLHKVFHLWDTLLLGNSSFPLCIGVAILHQLRDQLLSFGFNECILLFSDMPGIDIGQCVQDSIKIFCSTPKSATYRQHARPPRNKEEAKSNSRPNLSYYSTDYHDLPAGDLSMEPIPLEDLKTEKCPRISAEDLIELSELTGPAQTRSPTKKRESSKPKILIVDSRTQDEFTRGTLPGSINIPFNTAFTPEGTLNPCPAVSTLQTSRSQVKVIVGNRGKNATHFAAELVRLGFSKVCVLHKGIDVLRQTGLLTVPPPEL